MAVKYWRDYDGVAHVVDHRSDKNPIFYIGVCGTRVPKGEIKVAESVEDIDRPRAVDCHEVWDNA